MQRSRLRLSMAFLLRNRSFLSAHSEGGEGSWTSGDLLQLVPHRARGRGLLCAGLDHTSWAQQ